MRREIKRLQSALLDCQNENIDRERQIEVFKQIIKEKDDAIGKVLDGAQSKDGQNGLLRGFIKEKDLQIEALIAKMDEMKRKIDELTLKELDSKALLEQMNSSDFAK